MSATTVRRFLVAVVVAIAAGCGYDTARGDTTPPVPTPTLEVMPTRTPGGPTRPTLAPIPVPIPTVADPCPVPAVVPPARYTSRPGSGGSRYVIPRSGAPATGGTS